MALDVDSIMLVQSPYQSFDMDHDWIYGVLPGLLHLLGCLP